MEKRNTFLYTIITTAILFILLSLAQNSIQIDNVRILETQNLYTAFNKLSPILLFIFSFSISFLFQFLYTRKKNSTMKKILYFYISFLLGFSSYLINDAYKTATNPLNSEYMSLSDYEISCSYNTLPPIYFIDANLTKEEVKTFLDDNLMTQPSILYNYVDTIYLCEHEDFIKIAENYNVPTRFTIAFASNLNNEVFIDLRYKNKARNTITHELAHLYHHHIYSNSNNLHHEIREFYNKYDHEVIFKKMNDVIDIYYAKTDEWEFFAETSVAYFHYPDKMKKYMNDYYLFLHDKVFIEY